MLLDHLPADLRLSLRHAFDTLADVLDEETGRVAHGDSAEMDQYLAAKRQLFEQLAILLKEARRAPPMLAAAEVTDVVDLTTEPVAGETAAGEGGADAEADPADPELVRAAAARLRKSVEDNTRALTAAQDAVSTLTRHLARVVDRERADGVYGRSGAVGGRNAPSFTRVEHEL